VGEGLVAEVGQLKAPRWARLNQAEVGDASRLEHLAWAGGAARCRRMRVVVKAMRLSRSELVWVNRTWLEISFVLRTKKASGGSGAYPIVDDIV
jgi:hypothetical protein